MLLFCSEFQFRMTAFGPGKGFVEASPEVADLVKNQNEGLQDFMNVLLCWCLQELLSLEEQLDRLKTLAPAGGAGGDSGPVGDRLAKLQQDAGVLANTTENMLKALEGNAAKPQHIFSVLEC